MGCSWLYMLWGWRLPHFTYNSVRDKCLCYKSLSNRVLFCCFLLICAHVLCWCYQTQLLETLLAKDYGGSEDLLLGELQFAFIALMVRLRKYGFFINLLVLLNLLWHFAMMQMGQSLEAFLQWKSLVSLLFGCTEAVSIFSQPYLVWIMRA